MLIYNCLNVLIVCISFHLRFICVSFAVHFYFHLTNNMLIDICLWAIFAVHFPFHFRFICGSISFICCSILQLTIISI